ncbi:MAG TPA: transcription elongation factor GreB [Oligoflexia bacterium]|nr:transcription elongation factor GreB [Oligoflexia bacterium]
MGSDTKNYITPGGFTKLKDELKQLLDVERPTVVRTVSWAASNGDRSENGDYIYGKRRLREIDRRIRFLSKRIESAEVIDPAKQSGERVVFGALVEVETSDGTVKRYQIVGIDESEPAVGRLSWISPIAKALLGKKVGDLVLYSTPKGEEELAILKISFS